MTKTLAFVLITLFLFSNAFALNDSNVTITNGSVLTVTLDPIANIDKVFIFTMFMLVFTAIMLIGACATHDLTLGIVAFAITIITGVLLVFTDTSTYMPELYRNGIAITLMLSGVLVLWSIVSDVLDKKKERE